MIYAINDVNGGRAHIINAQKNKTYSCELCGDRAIPHQGNVMPWHFNHAENLNCTIGPRRGKGCIISTIHNSRNCKASVECDEECDLK